MKNKNFIEGSLVVIISVLVVFVVVQAGSITPPAGAPSAQFYTLSEIYEFITNNTVATENGHGFTFSDDLSGTRHTLTEIYSALAGLISADKVKLDTTYLNVAGTLVPFGGDATTANVLDGKTFFGDSQADWNLQTGVMTNVGAQTITPTITNQTITQGYHDGAGYCEGDANLISTNIKSGITIFGIDGDGNVVDTSTGDAIAGEMLSGKVSWADGSEITGTMPDKEGDNVSTAQSSAGGINYFTAPTGFYDGDDRVSATDAEVATLDTDIATGNIRSTVTIFGIDGDGNVVNTSSGDAIASDTLSGKISWVDGIEITGDMPDKEGDNASTAQSAAVGVNYFTSPTGFYDGDDRVSATDAEIVALDADLATGNIKFDTNVFGTIGTYSGYPGTGWSGSGLTEATCATAGNWEWFEDANGDGDFANPDDPEDGICVRTATVDSDSWNGAEQMVGNGCYPTACDSNNECSEDSLDKCDIPTNTSTGSTLHDATTSGWTNDKWKNYIVKIEHGEAVGCWGRIKSNDSNTLTLYGSWLTSAYASNCGTPDSTSYYKIYDDDKYDNSWIGDYGCYGTAFPNGSVTLGSYPSSACTIALAVTDCYDGVRDLLPDVSDRAVISGTATDVLDATLTDTNNLAIDTNVWIGQKVLITGGTGIGTYGIIESNDKTAESVTVAAWSGTAPITGSTYQIIYIAPHSSYTPYAGINGSKWNPKENNGPLMAEYLKEWKGTRLPTSNDFFGFCGYKNGGSDYETTTGTYTDDKTYGNYGGQIGRTDEFMDLANTSWEWLSEQHYYSFARVAGGDACSYFGHYGVYSSARFRGVFRP